MLTYQELLEQALQLEADDLQALVAALQLALAAYNEAPLGSFARLAAGGLMMTFADTPDNLSEHADEFLNELMKQRFSDHETNAD